MYCTICTVCKHRVNRGSSYSHPFFLDQITQICRMSWYCTSLSFPLQLVEYYILACVVWRRWANRKTTAGPGRRASAVFRGASADGHPSLSSPPVASLGYRFTSRASTLLYNSSVRVCDIDVYSHVLLPVAVSLSLAY